MKYRVTGNDTCSVAMMNLGEIVDTNWYRVPPSIAENIFLMNREKSIIVTSVEYANFLEQEVLNKIHELRKREISRQDFFNYFQDEDGTISRDFFDISDNTWMLLQQAVRYGF